MKHRTILATALIGLALAGATVMQARNASPLPGAAPPSAGAEETPTTAPRGVAAEGRVVTYPGAEVRVSAERSGRLVRVLVDEAQRVPRGQLLAELESDELRAALAEAQARVAESDAEIRLAEATLARQEQLVAQQIAASHDLDQARRDLETAQARRETARAEVARYEAQIRKTRIVAPIGGTVTLRHVDAGETVETGDAIATIADLDRLRIEGEADEADAPGLAVGAEVTITSDGYPGRRWTGRVEEVADSVTPRRLKAQDPARPTDARVLAVKVAFAQASPLKLGTTVNLRIAPPR
jgi:HlyD family secretion protein